MPADRVEESTSPARGEFTADDDEFRVRTLTTTTGGHRSPRRVATATPRATVTGGDHSSS